MLATHQSDPPDVPSLTEAGDTLESLINTGALTVRMDS